MVNFSVLIGKNYTAFEMRDAPNSCLLVVWYKMTDLCLEAKGPRFGVSISVLLCGYHVLTSGIEASEACSKSSFVGDSRCKLHLLNLGKLLDQIRSSSTWLPACHLP